MNNRLGRAVPALLAAVVLTAIGVGCGSSGEAESNPPLTKAQFTNRANAICTKASKARSAIFKKAEIHIPKGKAAQDAFIRELVVPFMRAVSELEELRPPPQDAKGVEAMITSLRVPLEELRRNPNLTTNPFEKFDAKVETYNLVDCVL